MKDFNIIWKMLIHLKEECFNKNAMTFFELFSKEGISGKNRRKLWYNLIIQCMKILESNNDILGMNNSIKLLKYLIEESERKGTSGLKSHIGSLESNKINLSFNNLIHSFNRNDYYNNESEFDLELKSNLTIWDLKKILSKRVNVIPQCIKLIVYGETDLTDKDNGKLLSEKFSNGIKINIAKSNILEEIPKEPLIDNGQLTEKAKKVFAEIFEEYSTNGKMDKEQCSKFAYKAMDSHNPINSNDEKIIEMFEKYDYDKDDLLDLKGFYEFYLDSLLLNKETIVWDNIKAFNYRYDLKKINDNLDDFNNDSDYEFMPRYILSNQQKFFDIIFNILINENNDNNLRKEANLLINMICTNEKLKNIVICLNEDARKGRLYKNTELGLEILKYIQ
jgi:ubiquitin carboxyl-terminal hydrolase 34